MQHTYSDDKDLPLKAEMERLSWKLLALSHQIFSTEDDPDCPIYGVPPTSYKKLRSITAQQQTLLCEIKQARLAKRNASAVAPLVARRTHQPRRVRHAGEGNRSSMKSDDGNDADPEPERSLPSLFDYAALAKLLRVSVKTLQNRYSSNPHTLPLTITVPGARGPRWTPENVQHWLEHLPRHTLAPVPAPAKRKVGRPRIAQSTGKGGVK